MSADAITFLASFPPIQSAMKFGQDGARIQIDIPESDIAAAAKLLLMRGKVLRITVEAIEQDDITPGDFEWDMPVLLDLSGLERID